MDRAWGRARVGLVNRAWACILRRRYEGREGLGYERGKGGREGEWKEEV